MSSSVDFSIRVVLIGAGATAVMDVWLAALQAMKVPTLDFALLGRWVGHLFRGRFFHDGIKQAEPVRNELLVGWLAHYAIGIFFAVLLVAVGGLDWLAAPTPVLAISVGLATATAPLFILQPAMGSGIASSRTATPLRNCLKSVAGHGVFGCGLYLAAILVKQIQFL